MHNSGESSWICFEKFPGVCPVPRDCLSLFPGICQEFSGNFPTFCRECPVKSVGYTRESLGSCPGNPCQDLGKADWLPVGNSAILLGAGLVSLEKPCSTLGKTLGRFLQKLPGGLANSPGLPLSFPGGFPGHLGKFPRLLPGISRKVFGRSLGNARGYTRTSPWAIPGNPCKFARLLPGLSWVIFGES